MPPGDNTPTLLPIFRIRQNDFADASSLGLTVVGSSVGTASEMEELLQMAVKGDIVPQISVFDFDEINNIMEKLARFEIGGRVVLRIPQ